MTRGEQPAFPVLEYERGADGNLHPQPVIATGMTIRELYVGLIAAGLSANPHFRDTAAQAERDGVALEAHKQADALLADEPGGKT
jgi:hypothetical protein